LIREGRVRSVHDCSDGGLAVALAECCTSSKDRKVGAVVRLTPGRLRNDAVLFGESQSRIVLSAKKTERKAILERAESTGVPAEVIGGVGGEKLVIYLGNEHSTTKTVDLPVPELYEHWACSIERMLSRT
jgi:phosphoribosylformylglycinamidine synthase